MFAVIEVGSAQFKIAEGDMIDTDVMEGEEGTIINLDKVLMLAKDSDIRVGQPYLKGVKVRAKIVRHYLDEKVTIFKYRRRKNSATKRGHRQRLTTLNIEKIEALDDFC